jgi:integrase
LGLALVKDLREARAPLGAEEIEEFETDVLAGFVLARAAAGPVDSTIRNDVNHLEQVRAWLERPLWDMQPSDADAYFGKALRQAKPSTRTSRAGALSVYFEFLELRHKAEIYNLTGRVVECPLDEINRPRASVEPQLRIPPTEAEIDALFAGWRGQLAVCRKFAPTARNYVAARLAADVGVRINEMRMLDLDDVRWELGQFGKLNVRHGKGSRRRGPKPRLVPLIDGADSNLRWYIEDVWGNFDVDHTLPGAPLFPSERRAGGGAGLRATADVFRRSLGEAADAFLPTWAGRLTPHVLRRFCASRLYLGGMSLYAILELLGHAWTGTTARYVYVHAGHIEEAWCGANSAPTNAGRD